MALADISYERLLDTGNTVTTEIYGPRCFNVVTKNADNCLKKIVWNSLIGYENCCSWIGKFIFTRLNLWQLEFTTSTIYEETSVIVQKSSYVERLLCINFVRNDNF